LCHHKVNTPPGEVTGVTTFFSEVQNALEHCKYPDPPPACSFVNDQGVAGVGYFEGLFMKKVC
jgi:hypothetical protein